MVPLMGDKVTCPVCEKREVYLFFITLADLDKHLGLHHGDARIQWGCLHCERSFPKLYGVRCHIPKYSGTSLSKEGVYKCEACPMSFGTQRELSTYERRTHPAIRNEKRRGPPNSRTWMVEEVNLLKELDEIYKDYKYPNIEISKILTTKTLEQIKKKEENIENK
jgi:hypothetical protein